MGARKNMNKPLLVSLLIIFFSLSLSVVLYFLIVSFVKLYALSTVPVTALTMNQGFQILTLALGISVLVMFTLVFLFLVLELALKKEGGGVCWYA